MKKGKLCKILDQQISCNQFYTLTEFNLNSKKLFNSLKYEFNRNFQTGDTILVDATLNI